MLEYTEKAAFIIDDEETIWHVDFEERKRGVYVVAPNKKKAFVVLKRMYRAPRYDFDWEECEITDSGYTNIESAVRGNNAPFKVLVAFRHHILQHEKQANQGDYKGMYHKKWNR